MQKITLGDVREHLCMNGIDTSYTKWIWHGEKSRSEYVSHKRSHMEDGKEGIVHLCAKTFGVLCILFLYYSSSW